MILTELWRPSRAGRAGDGHRCRRRRRAAGAAAATAAKDAGAGRSQSSGAGPATRAPTSDCERAHKFYLTTAIDYANGDPHLGHAYEKIGADVIARYHRLRGDDVHFLTGMDEHGQKVAQSAAQAGVRRRSWSTRSRREFQRMWERAAHLLRPVHSHDRGRRTRRACTR